MRIPLRWLAEHADLPPDASAAEVADALVRVGLEEEAVHRFDVSGPVVVGRVVDLVAEPQSNGKTINWCQVDVGAHNLQGAPRGIVCGAHNFGVGDLVVVALPGAVLPGGFAITARRTYGHVSDGMICSARELALGEDHAGIIVLDDLGLVGEPGQDAVGLLGLDEQTVEINVTPDRGYCLSVRGVAREFALATGGAFRDPAQVHVPPPDGDAWPVRLRDDLGVRGRDGCHRYVARVVRSVAASAPSPYWMQHRLHQAGMRPISLAVDVTNYVMLATGQPLHAFDLTALRGPIVVRRARAGERLETLDGVVRTLHLEDLLITDEDSGGDSRVLAIAGVMGGASSEVGQDTRDVLVESANFDQLTVARSSRRHRLSTEASRRFERGVDQDVAGPAAELAVRLLVEYGGGVADPGYTDVDRRMPLPAITMPAALPERLVGVPYSQSRVEQLLTGIGCEVQGDGALLHVQPPSWRPDLGQGADLVEEVARLDGYDAIPSVLPQAPPGSGLTASQRARRSVARTLADLGFVETLSNPFVGASRHDQFGLPDGDPRRHALRLANPLSEEAPELRTSLLATLVDTLRRNVSRGFRDLALFEVGLVVRPRDGATEAPLLSASSRPSDEDLARLDDAVPPQPRRVALVRTGQRELPGWWGQGRLSDWSDAVQAAQAVASVLRVELTVSADHHAPWHPGRCARLSLADGTLVGHAGELAPAVVAGLELPERTVAAELDLDVLIAAAPPLVAAQPISTYPQAHQDVALVVADDVPAAEVTEALRAGGGPLLESVRMFDVYTGEQVGPGRRSLAYRLAFRAPDRTLTAQEASAARMAAVAEAERRTGAELRGA